MILKETPPDSDPIYTVLTRWSDGSVCYLGPYRSLYVATQVQTDLSAIEAGQGTLGDASAGRAGG